MPNVANGSHGKMDLESGENDLNGTSKATNETDECTGADVKTGPGI